MSIILIKLTPLRGEGCWHLLIPWYRCEIFIACGFSRNFLMERPQYKQLLITNFIEITNNPHHLERDNFNANLPKHSFKVCHNSKNTKLYIWKYSMSWMWNKPKTHVFVNVLRVVRQLIAMIMHLVAGNVE